MKNNNIRISRYLLLAVSVLIFATCGNSDDDAASAYVTACGLDQSPLFSGTIASGEETASLRVVIEVAGKGSLGYTAALSGGDWISFSVRDFSETGRQRSATASVGENLLFLYYKANGTAQSRSASFSITFDDGSTPYTVELTQLAANASDDPFVTNKQWPELPEKKENANYIYAAHYGKMNLKTVRNYSLCFDKTLRLAHWVAYPLHSSYIGSLDRSDAWAADPKIPQQYQAALWLGSYQNGTIYNRGHQIPSKDRSSVEEMNKQTFYASNMTPQRARLNQQMWSALETKVRGYVCADTLYVVSGCYFANYNNETTDKAGNICPIPTNYFKVLLRTRTGQTGKRIADCTASELRSIGFWVENENGQTLNSSLCKSVEEIENLTGFTFFPDVDASVKRQCAPDEWGF